MKTFLLILLILFVQIESKADLVLNAAEKELTRSMNELSSQDNPPYYISYNITDSRKTVIKSTFGKLISSDTDEQRILDIDLRVGSYQLDNTHIIRGNPFNFSFSGGLNMLPIEDNEEAIRAKIWFATDKEYKDAIERYERVVTNTKVKVEEEDKSPDFSKEQPVKFIEESKKYNIDEAYWGNLLNELSGEFSLHPWIYQGDVVLQSEELTKYFVNSEGSRLKWDESYVRMYVLVKTKAVDGMSLPLYESYFAWEPESLPPKEKILDDIRSIIQILNELKSAPMAETFTGPAILSGEAAGVFFHEIFGHRVEGHREKDPNSSQTFKQSVDEKILPEFISVIFDPTIREIEGIDISGYYKYDDQGVKAQKVVSVENGIFKGFLMSRSPIEDFPNSNGHGRKQAGYTAVSRQSNLIVKTDEKVSEKELFELLREECKKQNTEYGLYFKTVQGGFTFTGRSIPNAFNVTPLVVYKVFADGRPNEMVRGVDLIGTPLTTFSNIIASAENLGIFNGICGAESGGVPVSASSPSLLVSRIEVQKKKKSQAKPPILPSPVIGAGQ